MNIFLRVMEPQIAMRTLVEALEEEGYLEGAVIAHVPEEGEPRILWPEGGMGTFRV
jgi:hypothetical protein